MALRSPARVGVQVPALHQPIVRPRSCRRALITTAASSQPNQPEGRSQSSATQASRDSSAAATSSSDKYAIADTSSGAGESILGSLDEAQQQEESPQSGSGNIFTSAWNSYNSSLQTNPVRTKAGAHISSVHELFLWI